MVKIDFKEVVKKASPQEIEQFDGNTHISIPRVKYLRGEKGLSYSEIGTLMGYSKQRVHQVCRDYNITKEGIKKYKGVREANWLHNEEQLSDLTTDQIKEMSPLDRLKGAGISFDKVQILSGQPTQVIAYVDMVAGFKELEKQRQAEIDKLGYDPADVVEGEVIEDDLPNAT